AHPGPPTNPLPKSESPFSTSAERVAWKRGALDATADYQAALLANGSDTWPGIEFKPCNFRYDYQSREWRHHDNAHECHRSGHSQCWSRRLGCGCSVLRWH